jgi:hypothetical protein
VPHANVQVPVSILLKTLLLVIDATDAPENKNKLGGVRVVAVEPQVKLLVILIVAAKPPVPEHEKLVEVAMATLVVLAVAVFVII